MDSSDLNLTSSNNVGNLVVLPGQRPVSNCRIVFTTLVGTLFQSSTPLNLLGASYLCGELMASQPSYARERIADHRHNGTNALGSSTRILLQVYRIPHPRIAGRTQNMVARSASNFHVQYLAASFAIPGLARRQRMT